MRASDNEMQRLTDNIVDMLTAGNRPIRILLFGGIFLAWLIMTILAKIFGVNTNVDGDINFSYVILIMISLFTGFGASYALVNFLDARKRQRERQK